MSIKARQSAESVSSSINAMLSVLNGVTPLSVEKTNGGVSLTLSSNPFEYVMSLLQKVAGYDRVVEFLAEIVAYGLPMLEDSLKIALVESLKDLFSCSVNPVINEELIKYGVILDLSTIDLMGILKRCPLGTENELFKINGSFFYFDVERFTIPDELERCKDLNAVIWYVKHRATDRTVWYGYEHQDEEHELLSVQNGTSPGTLPSEKDGVITMEFSEKSSQLTDCEGNSMSIQVPHGNCLHVFLGNTKGVSDEIQPSYSDILDKTNGFRTLYNEVSRLQYELRGFMNQEQDISQQASIQCDINVLEKIKKAINDGIPISRIFPNLPINASNGKRYITIGDNTIYLSEYTYTHSKNDLSDENKNYRIENYRIASNYQYRTPQENYYYGKTLFEFNTDYIQSVKFFDSTVLACQIVDIMTGCFGVSLNLSFEERLIRNEVEQMLQKIVENSKTITVSDCFFTFTNDEYNLMVDETEKERIGKYTGSLYGYGSTIDYNKIYEELDEISSCATLSEQVTVIKRSFNEISKTIKPEEYKETDEFSLNFSFLNNLLKSLTLSVVYNIISPKIYMLMAINLKILGREPNFDVVGFITYFKTLLINVIKNITDSIMAQMSEWLVSLVKELVQRLADRLLLEQAQYYMQLLMNSMRAFRLMWGEEDWNMADADYADIVSTNTTNSDRIRNTSC